MPKFKLLSGRHTENDPTGKIDPVTKLPVSVTYKAGDVFASKSDLDKRFNQPPMSIKFERIHETPVAAAQQAAISDTLDAMTVEELKAYAESEELSLGKAKTREEMVKVLRAALIHA